jgi:hypothetical protein
LMAAVKFRHPTRPLLSRNTTSFSSIGTQRWS